MKSFSCIALSFIVYFLSSTSLAQQHQLVKKWETDSVMKVPESVLYDASNKVLYVANIDGQPAEKDGKGSIGKVGLDGQIIAVDWVTGLNAPKGMGLHKNTLYVADLTEVVAIDVKEGKIIRRIPVEGSQFLNDITIDKKGVVYVSDSRKRNVHRIAGDVVTTYLDSNSLKGPNGLLSYKKRLYVLDQGKMYRVEKDKKLTMLSEGMEGGTDGIENVKGKEFIVSSWGGVIYYVNEDGTKEKLLDTRDKKINSADIGYDAKNRIVYVPTFWKNSVVAYEVK